ncbi:hypothetical protein QTG54_008036 [Skeletonema marinoi]|uniref:MYND-type domain-containing protein n=1 Tax=Skeletonema marinoi TaxID=267567 RepID=A0AAD8Y989_9STRA|nr:hypothetical protein QTG54_008036 [Skeletonema marinoi]
MPNRTYSKDPVDEAAAAAAQQDDEARRKFWEDKIKKESGRRRLISDLIAKEFRRVNTGVDITDDIKANISKNSTWAHHTLYGFCSVVVLGPDRGDGAWTLPGTIHNWDTRWGGLEVELGGALGSWYAKLEDLHFVKSEQWSVYMYGKQEVQATKFTVAFGYKGGTAEGGEDISFQFDLRRSYVDKVQKKYFKSAALQEIRAERDTSTNCLDVKQEERIEEAAITEDGGRLASANQEQLEIKPSMEDTGYKGNCLHGYSGENHTNIEQFVALFCNECWLKTHDGIALEQCIQAAIGSTRQSHGGIWSNSNDMEIAISSTLFAGTEDMLNGRVHGNARVLAAITNFFEQWVAISAHKTQYDWYWPKIYELYNADEHTLVSFFRNRINCKCLDDKHREVRSIKKMGICCNPRCSLPERKLERSGMESCEQCRHVHYCSRKCQKNDWKRHKEACLGVAAKINVFDAQVAQCQSAYDDTYRTSLRLQQKKAICMNEKDVAAQAKKHIEAGVAPSDAHVLVKAAVEAVRKQYEIDFNMSETRRNEAWSALHEAKKMLIVFDST